ncbi:hypothetical protein Tco_0090792 [Tanacetum coccineum]
MSGPESSTTPPPPPQTPSQQAPHTLSTIKLPILKKGEYDIWAMKMEHYLSHTDYPIWETAEETWLEKRKKARTTLFMALPEDHLAKFHKMDDAKEIFGGNDESKKMQKYILKQPFEGFSISNSEGLHKGYDRFQSLLSQLEIHGASVSKEDANQKFLRAFESDVKSSNGSSSSTQNVAFVSSENTDSTNNVSAAYVGSTTSCNNSQREFPSSSSLLTNQSSCPQLDHEDLEQVNEFDLEEMDLKWQVILQESADSRGIKTTREKMLGTLGIDWTTHVEDEEDNYALMAFSNSGSDTEVTSCSKDYAESYANLKKLYDEQREQLGVASIEIQAYEKALKKVEEQLVAYQKNQLWYEEKIRYMKVDLDDKTNLLTYHKKLLDEAEKEKEELSAKVKNWQKSSEGLKILLNSQMSVKDKTGLGYGNHLHTGILSYETKVLESVFDTRSSDLEDTPENDRYAKGMHVVPPPMKGIYIPSGPDVEIDYSKFTCGPKQSQTSESETQTSDFDTCESNTSAETLESVPEPVVNEPNVVSQPKVWSDAPIIEEYESDSDDDCVSTPLKEQEQPSFAFDNTTKHVKTPREPVKEQHTHSKGPKVVKRDWNGKMSQELGFGYGFTRKACFVCGSFDHLIRDCYFHKKRMAKQAELNKRVSEGTGLRENRPVWNNAQRVNHQNQFVPTAVLTRTSKIPVNTARQNFLKKAVPRKVNTARRNFAPVSPKSNENDAFKRQNVFRKSHSPVKRPFQNKTVTHNMIWKSKANTSNANHVNTARLQAVVNTAKGYKGNVVKSSACWQTQVSNGLGPEEKLISLIFHVHDDPHKALKNKGIMDSRCSRHMTSNKAYLVDYQDYYGGPIAFRGSKGTITGKGKIGIGKLDF